MPHILLIEDNPGDARLIQELLRGSDSPDTYSVSHVERVGDAVALLSSGDRKFDIILSDITLPDSAGQETLATLTEVSSDVPVIFMTGTNNETLAIAAMQRGAEDYIVKGRYDGDALVRSLRYAVERNTFQLELQKSKADAEAARARAEVLSQQKRQLLALTRAKDEFISLASHQLRTPATAVKQYLGMIVEGYVGDVPEHLLELIQVAYTSNDRQLSVINDLLKTAQLDAEGFRLNLQPTDINHIVRTVMDDLRPVFEMRKQQTECDLNESLPPVSCDASEINLVFENLIGNASKYTPEHKRITVTTKSSKDHVCISIKDEGVGIEPADHKRIFEKFTRIDNELSDTVTGSGLGLYWVRRIVKLHHGTIRIKSQLHKGTEFVVTLPVWQKTS